MVNLLEEWKAACQARQQKKIDIGYDNDNKYGSLNRGDKLYQDDYDGYSGRRINVLATQKFPTGYASCPPNSSSSGSSSSGGTINMHLQNTFRFTSPGYMDPTVRFQPKIPIIGNYHSYQTPPETTYNHCETGHGISSNDFPNPLRTNYGPVSLRQSSINSQLQHYPENQRLYPESIRQFQDYSKSYQDSRSYTMPSRPLPVVNVLHEHRLYGTDVNSRLHQMYQDDSRTSEDVVSQRIMMDIPRQYIESQRTDNIRPNFGGVESPRTFHDSLFAEKQRQQYPDSVRQMDGPRPPPNSFQRPPLLTQRSLTEPSRMYKELDNDDGGFQRQDLRFTETKGESSTCRIYNPNHLKGGRSLSVEVQFVAGPPPPREMIPLQGAPGPPLPPPPPQGSPRPLIARGLQSNMHRLPSNSIVHYKKSQGAFT